MTTRAGNPAAPAGASSPGTCPDARISDPTRGRGDRRVVNVDSYIPYFLASINNALSRGASKRYLVEFGIGIVEWRVVSMLAIEPGITATRICTVVALDKAAASRALGALSDKAYLEHEAPCRDLRRKTWWLNAAGYELHDRVLAVALARERHLIAGADPEDLEALLRVMRIMRNNVASMPG